MSAYLSPIGNEQEADSNGAPVSGALINTYLAGTTTPIATYTDAAGLVPQANPIVCNSAGYPASPIYLPAGVAVKMVFTTSVASGSVAYRPAVDNIQGVNDPAFTTTISEWTPYSATPTFISATSFSVTGDQTLVFQVARRLRSTNTGGTIYSTVRSSTFSAGITTVVVINDSGSLDSGLSAVSYALLSATSPSVPLSIFPPVGECRLAKSGLNLLLSPFNGNKLTIGGVVYTIPSAGVSLAPTGLSSSTAYYIYAFMSSGTMTLEQSTTVPIADTTTGVKIKTGDATRTLVGQAVATSATVWSTSVLHVISYFNRRTLTDKGTFTANRVNANTFSSFAETSTEIRVNFICWADDTVLAVFQGSVVQSASGGVSYSGIGYDGSATPEDGVSLFQAYTVNASGPGVNVAPKALSEATLHFATQLGANTSGNGTWLGSASTFSRSSLQVTLQG